MLLTILGHFFASLLWILAIPLLVVVNAVCLLVVLPMSIVVSLTSARKLAVDEGHVVITGGSSGIGKAVASEIVKRGASVTLLARNKTKLSEAKAEIEKDIKEGSSQTVKCLSVDLSKDYEAVEKAINQAEEESGPIDMLVNCAGMAVAGRFDEVPIQQYQQMLDINYIGSVYATRAVIEGMKQRKRGRIVFTSSMAGQLGVYGYTAYSASKFALKGLAEALQMEVTPFNIHVCLSFPPDTDTPGYAEENKSKPEETHLISETAGLFKADQVAKSMVDDALAGRFLSFVGMDGWTGGMLTSGMAPLTSMVEVMLHVVSMTPLRLISLFYLRHFNHIIQKCKKQREQNLDSTSQSVKAE